MAGARTILGCVLAALLLAGCSSRTDSNGTGPGGGTSSSTSRAGAGPTDTTSSALSSSGPTTTGPLVTTVLGESTSTTSTTVATPLLNLDACTVQTEAALGLDIGLVNGGAVSDPVGQTVTAGDYADSTCRFQVDDGSGVEGSLVLTVYLSASVPFSKLLSEAASAYSSAGTQVAGAGTEAVLYYKPASPLDSAELLATNSHHAVAVQISESSLATAAAELDTITIAKALLSATQ